MNKVSLSFGSVEQLSRRLQTYLSATKKKFTGRTDVLYIPNSKLKNPSAVEIQCVPVGDKEDKYLFISDDKEMNISQFKLSSNGVYVSGTPFREIPYPQQTMVFQICISQESMFFSSLSGIHEVSLTDPLPQVHTTLQGNVRGLLVALIV